MKHEDQNRMLFQSRYESNKSFLYLVVTHPVFLDDKSLCENLTGMLSVDVWEVNEAPWHISER